MAGPIGSRGDVKKVHVIAKRIWQRGEENYMQAIKRAWKVLRGEMTEAEASKVAPAKKGKKFATPKRDIEKDRNIKAKKAGKRISAEGNVYYENRPNRSDKDLRRRLEDGGRI